MAVMTADEAKAYTDKHYVVLRSNVGEFEQGRVVPGANFRSRTDPDQQAAAVNLQRLLWGKHVREAYPEEVPLGKVTLEDSSDEEVASYQYRLGKLEGEVGRLTKQLVEANGTIQRLQAETRPRPPSQNEQASLALLKAKEDRLNDMELRCRRAEQEAADLRRDNEVLLARLTEPAPVSSSPADTPPQAAKPAEPAHASQPAAHRKPR